jgi:hypothetical protein
MVSNFRTKLDNYMATVIPAVTANEKLLLRQLGAVHAWLSVWREVAPESERLTLSQVLQGVSSANPILAKFFEPESYTAQNR